MTRSVAADIPLSVPHLAGNEGRYLSECLESNFVSSVGPFVERFERDFAAVVGAKHAVACSTGTAALHVALQVVGAGPGTTVATSTFTFVASVNAVTYCGAKPLLVDSERDSWNLDASLLYDRVVEDARAGRSLPDIIEVVHVLGHPADLEPILELRERFGIPIVEDAAEALGASYRAGALTGRQVGTVGDLGCFSFNGNKTMTTGGGGMIITNDLEKARLARHLTTQAKLAGREYVHDLVGFNYRLTNVAAALGVAQLEQLEGFLEAKRVLAHRYRDSLGGLRVEGPPYAPWANPSFWLYSILLTEQDDRDRVLDCLQAAAVQARPLWFPIHRQVPYAAAERLGGDVADDLHRRGISLPSSVGLSAEDQTRVVEALSEALDH